MDAATSKRMTDRTATPSEAQLEVFLGQCSYRCWQRLRDEIEYRYPDVFEPDWIYGGAKHGWNLRYKKSRSFCTLIPERGQMRVQIVFGASEREKLEATVLNGLQPATRKLYHEAPVFHDGKWMLLTIDSERMLDDVFAMLTVKRKPKKTG